MSTPRPDDDADDREYPPQGPRASARATPHAPANGEQKPRARDANGTRPGGTDSPRGQTPREDSPHPRTSRTQPTDARPRPSGGGSQRSGEDVPDPESPGARRLRDTVRALVLAVIAAALASTLHLPWLVLSPILAIGALVLGVRALVLRRRIRDRRAPLLVIVSLALGAMIALSGTAAVATWPATAQRQVCLDRALTVTAQTRCEAAYTERIQQMLNPFST